MICVEVPIKTLVTEIEKLHELKGETAALYAQGAIEALEWVLKGKAAPSQNTGFPVFKKAA